MASYFKWVLGSYTGGGYAAHPSWKSYHILRPTGGHYSGGALTIVARDTSTMSVNLGFQPNLLMLISYRPRYANGSHDANFGGRGGGMTIGVAGIDTHGADTQFTWSTRIQQGWDISTGMDRWREDVCFNVVHGGEGFPGYSNPAGWPGYPNFDAYTLVHSFTATGFDLTPVLNLYDGNDTLYWFAAEGDFQVGVINSGDTTKGKFPFKPEATVFFSGKVNADDTQPPSIGSGRPTPDPWHVGYWGMMTGFASVDGQVCTFGGARPSSWNWTTEYFSDRSSIILPTTANNSGFVGTSLDQEGFVSAWWENTATVTITRSGTTATVAHTGHGFTTGQLVLIDGANQQQYNGVKQITFSDANHYTFTVTGSPATPATGTITATVGGFDLQWPYFNNIPYRVGFIASREGESGYFQANEQKRPGGSEALPDGTNLQPTRLNPRVILMATTNYNFDYTNPDYSAEARTINGWGFGGGGGVGWHWYTATDVPAYGIHTFGNGVQEMGHYSNSGTNTGIDYIMSGAGTSSNPPAGDQHSINVIPSPMMVGTNVRSAERGPSVQRLLVDPSDT